MPDDSLKGSNGEEKPTQHIAGWVAGSLLILVGVALVTVWFFDGSVEPDTLRPVPSDVPTGIARRGSRPKEPATGPRATEGKMATDAPLSPSVDKAEALELKAIKGFLDAKSLSFVGRDGDFFLSDEELVQRGLAMGAPYPLDTSPSSRPHFGLLTVRSFQYPREAPRPTEETAEEEIPLVTLWTLDDRELPNAVEVVKREVQCHSKGFIEKYHAAQVVVKTWFRIRDFHEFAGKTIRVKAFWRGWTRTTRIAVANRDIELRCAIWDESRPRVIHLLLEADDEIAFAGIRKWTVTVQDAQGRTIRVEPVGNFDRPNKKTGDGVPYWNTIGAYDFALELVDPADVAYPLAIRLDIEDPYGVKKSTEAKLYAPIHKKR